MKKWVKAVTSIFALVALGSTMQISSFAKEPDQYHIEEYEDRTVIYFDDLTLSLDLDNISNSTVYDESESDYSTASTRSTQYLDYIPQYYWGAYNTDDDAYFLQINGKNSVIFKGLNNGGVYVFCPSENLTSIYFEPGYVRKENLTLKYSGYYTSPDSGNPVFHDGVMSIGAIYDNQNKTFRIYNIIYYFQ